MRHWIPLVAALLLLSPAVQAKKDRNTRLCDEFDVFLLIGQSNMAGRGYLFPDDREVMDGVFILNDRDEIVPANQPLNRFSSIRKKVSLQAGSPAASFASDIRKATGRKVLLVVNARGGTSARMWMKGAAAELSKDGEDDDLRPGDPLPVFYDEAVRRTREACRYGTLKAILYHQGENDAYEKYAPLWSGKVASIAEDLRRDLRVGEEVPFIVGELNRSFSRAGILNPEMNKISKVIPNSDYVSAEGCNANKDNLHFSRQGVTLLGHRYARKVLQMAYGFSAAAAIVACSEEALPRYGNSGGKDSEGMYLLCDFDSRSVLFREANSIFSVVPNPAPDASDGSALCGKITLKGGTWDCVACSPDAPIDLTGAGKTIRLKVLPPRPDASVSIKLSPLKSSTAESVILNAQTGAAGVWQELVFDLSSLADRSNFYQNIYIMCDGGTKITGEWYFDDLYIPDDDISALSLFKRVAPPLRPDPSLPWMCNSIANPEVLPPSETPDGRWWLLARGGDGSRSHLGYFTQDPSSFDPVGPWTPFEGNPVIPAGWNGTADSRQAIDPCGFLRDGLFYFYYKGISADGANSVLLATTPDGRNFTRVDAPWKSGCGVADVFAYGDSLYLYVSRRMYAYTDPLSSEGADEFEILQKGGGPSNCDWYSINGGKVFRLEGVDKWFLAYQCGTCNPDFPQRFHLAYSDDLRHWTKVDNPQPLFTRGPRGAWDQGAIWAPSVFEYGGMLYMYYEGWGVEGNVADRDRQYFLPGHSQIGIASCSKEDFLNWCHLL